MSLSPEALQEELQQCQTLLSLLSEKMYYLSQAISVLSGNGQDDADSTLFQSKSTEGNKNDSLFQSNILQGNKDDSLFHSNIMQGNKDGSLFHSNILQWNKKDSLFHSNNLQGNKEAFLFQSRNMLGNKEDSASANNIPQIPTAQQLYKALRYGMLKGVRHATIRRIVDTLLWILNNPQARLSQKSLATMLKLSKGGVAKYMMMLFKRDLVVRTAFQNYALTEKSKTAVEEARYIQVKQ